MWRCEVRTYVRPRHAHLTYIRDMDYEKNIHRHDEMKSID